MTLGWGERTSSCDRGQHKNQKCVSKCLKTQQPASSCCYGGGNATAHVEVWQCCGRTAAVTVAAF